ncbi:peptidyl-prolyl cis-trans isomerase, EpsD family [Roseateles aquatilis]|uniref:Peptidyl-prolyl cis-trans isomerase, EpsD family n=1 Tax=Roseateles aquatilis TaxID=431061 RepID=A0A246JLV0_9BURK|nr:EpsD family peptidyl-prolyl cis-trans isomerase [Roseateles aquatilis]OWQ93601.1 peptidyl-prolyl cis-trans isomerase, EpsD family [Roseateles aquatilis]
MNLKRTQVRCTTVRLAGLSAAVVTAVALVACGGGSGAKASQTAAKVNKEEITVHQINFVLQRQPNIKPEQVDAASRQILERLIDQELAVQKAQDLKLDRDPRVVQQIETAKREIIARAYAEHLGETATKPTEQEIKQYYADKPALFAERRIYNLQEINIEAKPEQYDSIRTQLQDAKTLPQFLEGLKAGGFRFVGTQLVRSAEQIPLNNLDAISRLKDGQFILNGNPTGLTVLYLAGSQSQPATEAQARPSIELFLLNQRRSELVAKDIKAMRENARIEYVGKFAEGAASAPASTTPALPAASDTPLGAASGPMDNSALSKGLGIK